MMELDAEKRIGAIMIKLITDEVLVFGNVHKITYDGDALDIYYTGHEGAMCTSVPESSILYSTIILKEGEKWEA